MSECHATEDPELLDRVPTGRCLFVPVRSGPNGCTARFFRTALGGRTAVAFTSPQRLVRTLGPDQPWIRLSEPAPVSAPAPASPLAGASPRPADRTRRDLLIG